LIGNGIRIVPEHIDDICGSYIMIDPRGCFVDDTTGQYLYSRSLLDVGLDEALSNIQFDYQKFTARGRDADFNYQK
jgi:radical S-adenosyl methionine domain-containing protein 2